MKFIFSAEQWGGSFFSIFSFIFELEIDSYSVPWHLAEASLTVTLGLRWSLQLPSNTMKSVNKYHHPNGT